MFFCYLLTGALAGLVVACVLDDIHIYDMFFCYLLTGALAVLVVACVLDDIHKATTNPARASVNK
jgi:sugar phosphate permease